MHTKLEGTLVTSAATTISKILHHDSGLYRSRVELVDETHFNACLQLKE